MFSVTGFAQRTQSVSGRITDASGVGLPGVNVTVKDNLGIGTTTDADGRYSINVPDANAVLVFSYVGYIAQEITVGNQTTLEVTLEEDAQALKEVVVVGYGQARKTTYTGSVSAIESAEITRAPVADLSNNLVGRLSGVIATQRTGEPGYDGSNILIRGISTTGNNAPLIVVDGIPRSDYGFSQIDPNEIESISILKDAAAASVFGVRGANGVILITTKRGRSGRPQFALSSRFDVQQPTRIPQYLDSYNTAVLYNEALANEGKPPLYDATALQAYQDGSNPDVYPNTDWFAVTLNDYAPQMQHNLNVSGGTDRAKYFLSAGFLDQKGLYDKLNYKRYNFRSNIDVEATRSTSIRLDLTGRLEDRNFPSISSSGIFDFLTRTLPTRVATFSNGLPGGTPLENIRSGGYDTDDRNVFQSLLSVTQKLNFIPGLSIKGQVAYDRLFRNTKSWRTPYLTYGYDAVKNEYIPQTNGLTELGEYFEQNQSLTAEAHLNYAQTFGRSNVSALLLFTQTSYRYNNLGGGRTGFVSSAIDQLNVGGVSEQPVTYGGADARARRGLVGRVSYDFAAKYLLEASFRYDGSENFPPESRWGFFPSVSAGWRLSEEGFIKNNFGFIQNLKLRGSVGQLGNDVLGGGERFAYLAGYVFDSPYPFNGNLAQTLREGRLANQNITWEKATSANIGLDGSFWNDKLTFEIDYFYKLTTDILGSRNLSVPSSSGITQLPFENLDEVSNRGLEAVIGHRNQLGKVNLFLSGNVTFAKNRVEFKDEPADLNPNLRQTGRPIGQYFGLQAIGLFQSDEEVKASPDQGPGVAAGDIKYADINGDNKIDDKDRVAIGYSPIPELIFGFTMGASYGGFDANILWQGAGRVNAYVSNELAWAFFNSGKATEEHLDRWTPQNTDATYPRITTAPTANNTLFSSYWLRDASYLRLKNVELGYSLPASLMNRIGISQFRIFVLGQNLLTFDQLEVADPEGPGASNNAGRGWFYPQQKTYSLGVNLVF